MRMIKIRMNYETNLKNIMNEFKLHNPRIYFILLSICSTSKNLNPLTLKGKYKLLFSYAWIFPSKYLNIERNMKFRNVLNYSCRKKFEIPRLCFLADLRRFPFIIFVPSIFHRCSQGLVISVDWLTGFVSYIPLVYYSLLPSHFPSFD
jgi:hypothetical protein